MSNTDDRTTRELITTLGSDVDLTHPRMPGDVDISGEEILTAMRARDGFEKILLQPIPNKSKP